MGCEQNLYIFDTIKNRNYFSNLKTFAVQIIYLKLIGDTGFSYIARRRIPEKTLVLGKLKAKGGRGGRG